MALLNKVLYYQQYYKELEANLKNVESNLLTAQKQMDSILKEQDLVERTTVTLSQVKPLLSQDSIKQCISLANSCISSVFNLPYTLQWDPESQRFLLNKGDYLTDLCESEGGGLSTAISFVLNLFLLIKLKRRRFLAYDEAFTQVSAEYFPAFLEFVRKCCKELGVDLLLITHDSRITSEMVDHVYQIEGGRAVLMK